MDEIDRLQANLASVAADLLSERRFQPILRRIFSVAPGVWQTVASCCSGTIEQPRTAPQVFAAHADRFYVAYLPWPSHSADDPGCMILFVHDELWSTIAYFNRASLKDG